MVKITIRILTESTTYVTYQTYFFQVNSKLSRTGLFTHFDKLIIDRNLRNL